MPKAATTLLFLVCGVLLFPGCNRQPPGPKTVQVTGPIALDGQPIKEGNVIFRRLDGDLKSFGGRIQNGTYQITVEPGKMAVEVVASREVPGKFTMENAIQEPVTEMYIPRKYNAETELIIDVADDGKQVFSFELTSK